MSEHTPVPWHVAKVDTDDNTLPIVTEKHNRIAGVEPQPHYADNQAENAEFIVRACNAHDDLLAACEAMLKLTEVCTQHYRSNDERKAMKQAKAAIAKARGE